MPTMNAQEYMRWKLEEDFRFRLAQAERSCERYRTINPALSDQWLDYIDQLVALGKPETLSDRVLYHAITHLCACLDKWGNEVCRVRTIELMQRRAAERIGSV